MDMLVFEWIDLYVIVLKFYIIIRKIYICLFVLWLKKKIWNWYDYLIVIFVVVFFLI